jgi:hypothetical protein
MNFFPTPTSRGGAADEGEFLDLLPDRTGTLRNQMLPKDKSDKYRTLQHDHSAEVAKDVPAMADPTEDQARRAGRQM